MSKKEKEQQVRLQERIRRRAMKRRIERIVEIVFVSGFLIVEVAFGKSTDAPFWFGSTAYYIAVFGLLLIGFAIMAFVVDAGEKSEIDELEERMEQLFRQQGQNFNKLTKEIQALVKEIRVERKGGK